MDFHCFKCGSRLRTLYKGGKIRTVSSGSTEEHYKTCPGQSHQQVRAPRKPKPAKTQPIARFSFGEKPTHIQGRTTTGQQFKQQCAGCTVMPWEPCSCYPRAA